jgi:hypothetical protein
VDALVAHMRLQGTTFGTIIDVCRLQRAFELQYTDTLWSDCAYVFVIEGGQTAR